jgi:hypothetical protein
MRRAILHIEAEIRWHDEYDALLAAAGGGDRGTDGGGVILLDRGSFETAALLRNPYEITARDGDGAGEDNSR